MKIILFVSDSDLRERHSQEERGPPAVRADGAHGIFRARLAL